MLEHMFPTSMSLVCAKLVQKNTNLLIYTVDFHEFDHDGTDEIDRIL